MAKIYSSNKLLQCLLATAGNDQESDEISSFLAFDERKFHMLLFALKEKITDKSNFFDLSELAELMNLIDSSEPSQYELLSLLPNLMQFCLPSSLGILQICDILRKIQVSDSVRSAVLDQFKESVVDCSPRYLTFPGNRESFVQYSVNGLPCPNAYTINAWVYLEPPLYGHSNAPTSGKASQATLFKCRSPLGGIDCILMPKLHNNSSGESSFSHSMDSNFHSMDLLQTEEKLQELDEPIQQEFLITIRSMNFDSQTGTPDVFECTSTSTFTYNTWYLLTFVHQQHRTREEQQVGNK